MASDGAKKLFKKQLLDLQQIKETLQDGVRGLSGVDPADDAARAVRDSGLALVRTCLGRMTDVIKYTGVVFSKDAEIAFE